RGARVSHRCRRRDSRSSCVTKRHTPPHPFPRLPRSVVSPCRPLQEQLVQCQVRHRAAQPSVLRFQVFEALDLVALQPAELLAPAIICYLTDTDRADRLGRALALRRQDVNLPQLRDNLFWLVDLPWHHAPPSEQNHSSGWTTSTGEDHSR